MRHLFSISACGLIAGVSLLSPAAATAATASAVLSAWARASGSIVLTTSGSPAIDGQDDSYGDNIYGSGSGRGRADFDTMVDVPGLSGSAFSELDLTAGPKEGSVDGYVDSAFVFEIVNTTGADIAYEITYSLVGELTASYRPYMPGHFVFSEALGYAMAGLTVWTGNDGVLLEDVAETEVCVASEFYSDDYCLSSPTTRSGQFSFLDAVFSGVIAPGDELRATFYTYSDGYVGATPDPRLTPAPVPASLPLLAGGLGLLGMAGLRRRG